MKYVLELITLGTILVFMAAFAYTSSTGNHEWSGADAQAENVISQLTGGTFQPWFQSIYTPPSGEIESLMFALQAAIGGIIIGYFLGYYRALAKLKAADTSKEHDGELNGKPA
jgi:cobalt/nickel transport protein